MPAMRVFLIHTYQFRKSTYDPKVSVGERREVAVRGCNTYAEAEAVAIRQGAQVILQPQSPLWALMVRKPLSAFERGAYTNPAYP